MCHHCQIHPLLKLLGLIHPPPCPVLPLSLFCPSPTLIPPPYFPQWMAGNMLRPEGRFCSSHQHPGNVLLTMLPKHLLQWAQTTLGQPVPVEHLYCYLPAQLGLGYKRPILCMSEVTPQFLLPVCTLTMVTVASQMFIWNLTSCINFWRPIFCFSWLIINCQANNEMLSSNIQTNC